MSPVQPTCAHLCIPGSRSGLRAVLSAFTAIKSTMATDTEDYDLLLECKRSNVPVNSLLLLQSTRSAALTDIITMLRKEHSDSTEEPMHLDCTGDESADWRAIWPLLRDPLAEHNLTWVRTAQTKCTAPAALGAAQAGQSIALSRPCCFGVCVSS